LNSLSTNSTLSITNLNNTSTTLLTYINNLTNPSTLTTSNLNVSRTSTLNGSTTCISSLNVSGITTLSNNTTLVSSLNLSGITTFNNYTIINGNNQLEPKLLLSGQEYLVPYQTSTDGIALLLGANRISSRLLFIADSAKLIQNTTNPIMSLSPTGRIDCTSTDSSVRLPAVFNGALFTNGTHNITCISSLNISGFTTLSNNTTINSSLYVSGTTILNNTTTCTSSLNVSGTTTLINFVGIGNNGPFNSNSIFVFS
jgi:hypothetical protein